MFYHGGKAGLQAGDRLVPSPPHVTDGCPICVARAAGVAVTVGEYRVWLQRQGRSPGVLQMLQMLDGVPDHLVIDAPSERQAVYVTSDRGYARFYAARSQGDLYRVEPVGELEPTDEDHFPSWTVGEAVVVEVIERRVRLTRRDRRQLMREWGKADRRAARV
jgi:hypothetical protein